MACCCPDITPIGCFNICVLRNTEVGKATLTGTYIYDLLWLGYERNIGSQTLAAGDSIVIPLASLDVSGLNEIMTYTVQITTPNGSLMCYSFTTVLQR